MSIKAVIFDMDGVLVDSEDGMKESAIESLKRYDIEPDPNDFNEFTGMGEDRFIGGVAEKYGLTYEKEMKEYAYRYYVKNAKQFVKVFEDAKDVIEKTYKQSLVLAIASAADRIKVETNIQCIGVKKEWFQGIVTGSDVKKKKPDPEIFLHAAKIIKIDPQHCLVIEDAISGIQAAKKAGMKVAAVTTSFSKKELKKADPDFIGDRLMDVYQYIQTII